jgi:hypothetical protein
LIINIIDISYFAMVLIYLVGERLSIHGTKLIF